MLEHLVFRVPDEVLTKIDLAITTISEELHQTVSAQPRTDLRLPRGRSHRSRWHGSSGENLTGTRRPRKS
jgi:hypothetical protein